MKTLLDKTRIHDRVTELGRQLTSDFEGKDLTVIGVLTGSLVFLADLIRVIELPLQIGLVQASSYRGQTTTAGELELGMQLLPDLTGRHVLLVDDIFDTGHTLEVLCGHFEQRQTASLSSVVLLTKLGRCEVEYRPDYSGFDIPDEFVVGYGLDYDGEYRHLPYVASLEESDLRNG